MTLDVIKRLLAVAALVLAVASFVTWGPTLLALAIICLALAMVL